jgi:predicted phage-related endonuclease
MIKVPDWQEITKINGADHYFNLLQKTDEWHSLRAGIITGSTMKLILSPKLAVANNEKSRAHYFELAAERLFSVPTDHFQSYDMRRGEIEEDLAKNIYEREYAPIKDCGFIIKDIDGVKVGFSPDGLVGDEGMLECKSKLSKLQIRNIYEHMVNHDETPIPKEDMLQVQSGLLVSGRKWCDYLSYSNGVNLAIIRCYKIEEYQDAIVEAAKEAEKKVSDIVEKTKDLIDNPKSRIFPVEWIDHHEDIIA